MCPNFLRTSKNRNVAIFILDFISIWFPILLFPMSVNLLLDILVIINIDPTNCILWKSKVTSYCAEFHKCVKYFTLWFLCRNWCVSPRQTSFYDKVNLCPIELNSTSKWNILNIGFFVEICVYHHRLRVSSTSVFDNLVLYEHINMVVV